MTDGCAICGGVKFASEGSPMCGDCLLAMREELGVKVFRDGTVFYRIGPKRWIICDWKAKVPTAR